MSANRPLVLLVLLVAGLIPTTAEACRCIGSRGCPCLQGETPREPTVRERPQRTPEEVFQQQVREAEIERKAREAEQMREAARQAEIRRQELARIEEQRIVSNLKKIDALLKAPFPPRRTGSVDTAEPPSPAVISARELELGRILAMAPTPPIVLPTTELAAGLNTPALLGAPVQPPEPPIKGTFADRVLGQRGKLTQGEARLWMEQSRPWLTEASAPFGYVKHELLATWIIFEWATDAASTKSDAFEKWFGASGLIVPTFLAKRVGQDDPGTYMTRIRAQGLGISNLRPTDLLAETHSIRKLITTPGVPEDIKAIAKLIEDDFPGDLYRSYLYEDRRFSLFVLAATMQVLHERVREAEAEARWHGALKGVTPTKDQYEKLVSVAIEENRGTLPEVHALTPYLHPETFKTIRRFPPHRLKDIPDWWWAPEPQPPSERNGQ